MARGRATLVRVSRGLAVASISLAALALGACGTDSGARAAPGGDSGDAKARLPNQVLGLAVQQEDVTQQVEELKRPYISSVGLFSLRENDLVRATLQISRFNSLARPEDSEFRNEIINKMGSRRPLRTVMGKATVYATAGTEQNIFLWFTDKGFFVLTTHREYEFPRTLLRRMTELEI